MKKFFVIGLIVCSIAGTHVMVADLIGTLQKGFQALPVVKKYWQCLIGQVQCSAQELAQARTWLFNTPDSAIAQEVFITTGVAIGSKAIQDVRNRHQQPAKRGMITPIRTKS